MNIVLVERIVELSEVKSRFERLKRLMTSWKTVCITAVIALTVKVAAEQLAMMLIRGH